MGESLVYAIKVGLAVSLTMTFVAAIITIVSLLTSFVTNSILGEVMGLISIYLPFNPAVVFGVLEGTFIAILSFLVAQKIWNLTGQTYRLTS